jgi:hypothetical protein
MIKGPLTISPHRRLVLNFLSVPRFSALVSAGLIVLLPHGAHAQDLDLSPTRSTIANSAAIQSTGVLQVESGYDAFPQETPGNQQTVDTLIAYSALPRLRLDFGWSAFNHQVEGGDVVNGIGTIAIGGKIELKK